ncbi:hypothetical protein [Legionella quateirensis]|uniref:Uncharacterized protein n=1 Tax=Legionella quateirensis TaxID=45072 RepID=A0A378KSB6_9GAMM|nr:hypothetical protein [Legionella quateirensis]KTD42486.1 hypothetical protein Lqua_3464 [Legionella quateirensis]STY17059.1 Uncharacterised protein [Legionella quateirensis]
MSDFNPYLNKPSVAIELSDFPGGVAAWGALPAVFDSHDQAFDRGVHIHARLTEIGKKVIDKSFSEIEVIWQGKSMLLTEDSAVSYTMSSIFDFAIVSIDCDHCGAELLDKGWSAVRPSSEHYCSQCGGLTATAQPCVANPIIRFKEWLGDLQVQRPSIRPARTIRLERDRYPGGFQIWGSNPSIIWTAKRPEESAIHVHAYSSENKRVVDNTYSEVWVDDVLLDIEMVRVLQIQRAIPELRHDLFSFNCPHCNHPHFDKGLHSVLPHQHHQCEFCQNVFSTPESISNPCIAILDKLTATNYGVLENESIQFADHL